jgi:hypothetical protein
MAEPKHLYGNGNTMTTPHKILVVYWEWASGRHQGAKFWAAHSTTNDGRCADWPVKMDLKPIGAAIVEITEGMGLELIQDAASERPS